uniref:Cystatin domain-containing protein n=1 Tax=Strongyloides venezuelensis TaxID=75913 RepID=A0A0K0G4F1_STRVS
MNNFNRHIFVIVTFLLISEISFILPKYHDLYVLKKKDTNDKRIEDLAKQSVEYYNKKNMKNAIFAGVLKAEKEYIPGSSHYSMIILTKTICGNGNEICQEHMHSDIYKEGKFSQKNLRFMVYSDNDLKYR